MLSVHKGHGPDQISALENPMMSITLNLYRTFQALRHDENGQDLVEYALLVSLIALAAVTSVSSVAAAVNTVFTNISTSLV